MRLTLYVVGLGLWLTGILWLIFHYFLMQQTPFGLEPHPLEHWWLSLHGLFAFLALWVLGWLWGRHIIWGWKAKRYRLTGGLLFVILVVLVISGYFLYYPPNDSVLPIIAVLHWSIGLAVLIQFLLHRYWHPSKKQGSPYQR